MAIHLLASLCGGLLTSSFTSLAHQSVQQPRKLIEQKSAQEKALSFFVVWSIVGYFSATVWIYYAESMI